MTSKALEQKISDLKAAREAPDFADRLRKALKDRNNYYVSKAAALTADLNLHDLVPDLIAAFDRFLIDPAKTDPQCWAKNAVVKALKNLGHRDSAVFLRGINHFQYEPVWGGKEDTAATLRGACGNALIDSDLDDLEIFNHLLPLLNDPKAPVRLDGARAIGQMDRTEGGLLLRLKALCGDEEPNVVGQCFACILALEGKDATQFVAAFLGHKDEDLQLQAACALAESRRPEALPILREAWRGPISTDIREAMLTSLGASTLTESAEFLLSVIASDRGTLAGVAVTALSKSRFREEMRQRVSEAVAAKDEPRLQALFNEAFGSR